MKIILCVLFLLFCTRSFSQYNISGSIKDTSGIQIEFATIQLSFDSLNNQTTLSDSLGNYFFRNTKKGSYDLRISMIGYKTSRLKIDINQDTTINFVLQYSMRNLQTVTIHTQNKLIQSKSDKLIVNIGGNIETKGKSTIDILRLLPTVKVSDDAISMAGKSSVLVYINDYMVRLKGYDLIDYLNTLPTEDIKSIEIISMPPAQYNAEGNLGIIKINMKKYIIPGWKEYLQTGYLQRSYASFKGSGYVNYVGKKIFFEGKIQEGDYTYLNQNHYYSYFPNETNNTFNPKKWEYVSSDIQATMGYDIDANSNIIINCQIPIINKQVISDIQNKTEFINPISNKIDSTIFSNGKTTTKNYYYNGDIFFKHTFPNKRSYFTIDAAYLNNNIQNNRPFISNTQINNNNQTTDNYNTNGNQQYNIYTSQIDFVFPFLNCMVNTGSKLSFVNSSSNSNFFNVFNGNNVLVSSLSDQYNYSENIQALYYSMEKNIKDWSFKVGLRDEITETNGESLATNQSHSNNYSKLFPTIYISHDLNEKNSLSISYSKRIDRPPYEYLDPFKWYISKYDYAIGNPFLQPSLINNVELSYINNNAFIAKLYYSNQANQFGKFVVLDSTNITNQIQKTDNFLNIQSVGINISESFRQFKWLESEIQTDFSYSNYLSNRKEFANTFGYGGSVTLNNTFFFNSKRTFQGIVNIEEIVPGIYDYRNKRNSFQLDMGLNYIFAKPRLELRLFTTDIFKSANPQYYYFSNSIKQEYQNYFDSRSIRLVIVYKLGNWFNKVKKAPSPSNTEEKQRL